MQYNKRTIDEFHVCNNIDTCLQHLKRPENYNMAVGDSSLHLLSAPSYSSSDIYCFEDSESILTYHVSLLLKNGSKLEAKINRIIRNLFETGMFTKWNTFDQREQHIIDSNEPPVRMTVTNLLMGLICVLGIGIPLALIIFIMELVSFAKTKQNEKSRIWFNMHQICNPDRQYLTLE